MTSRKFREHMNTRPFVPYTICLADGRELRVVHPDFVAAGPGRDATVYAENGEYNHLDLLLVTGIRVEGKPESPAGVEG